MLIEHHRQRPRVEPSAWVAPTAVLAGNVRIGAGSRILYGAVLTAELGAELVVGSECVVMEQAVLRASGRFPLRIGDRVLVGPHAYLTGCTIGSRSFIATGVMVFNGATLGEDVRVSLAGKVHVATELPKGAHVPIGYLAVGRPGRILPPQESPLVHEELDRTLGGFMRYVFGVEQEGRTRQEVMDESMVRYTAALAAHDSDRVVESE